MNRQYVLQPSSPTSHGNIDYERELNPAQLEAVFTREGPILCLAGAGSGKTRTLVFRLARLVETGIPPESILLVTFSRKAAENMLDRATALSGAGGRKIQGGTYHSVANRLLRRHGSLIGLAPTFSILDEADAGDILHHLRNEMGLHQLETRFPQKKTLQEIRSATINRALTVKAVVEGQYPHFLEHLTDMERLFERNEEYKRIHQLLDYDDLLIFLHRLLTEVAEVRRELGTRFRYLMADEYQDTNLLQAQITLRLGEEHRNVMVVGDDAQSIYSFRGANFRNIRDFPATFPDARIIRLEENYRSTPEILAATNALMSHAREGFAKTLFTRRKGGEKPAVVRCSDESEQSRFVAQRILELREEGIPLDRLAVLFRSGFHAYQLELELKRRNIPFVKWGGFKFLEAAHIKDLIAHLRVLQNPQEEVAWQRVLLLVEGVGPKLVQTLREHMRAAADPYTFPERIPPRARAGLAALAEALKRARRPGFGAPQGMLEALSDYYAPILKARFDDYPKRLKDLDQLHLLAGRSSSLETFLSELALEPPRDAAEEGLTTDPDTEARLVLSTVHSAKGLEWHSVFVLWAMEGRFPSFAALTDPDELEEERRLMYVAMTRAEQNLYLCCPCQAWDPISGGHLSRPSRFLDEIGTPLTDTWLLSPG